MEKPVIISYRENGEPSGIERRLEERGYPIRVCTGPKPLEKALAEGSPDLFILEKRGLAAGVLKRLSAKARKAIPNRCRFIVVGGDGDEGLDLEQLDRLLDPRREDRGRKHLRLSVKLPGVYFVGGGSHIADVMALGTGGLFLKTTKNGFQTGQEVGLAIPLLGMKKEIEVTGRVAYLVKPTPENNYLQGIGLQFVDLETSALNALLEFILRLLLEEPARTVTAKDLESCPSRDSKGSTPPSDRGYRVSFDR